MSQIQGKFIETDTITDANILLRNNNPLNARNAANSANVPIVSVDASDRIVFPSIPQATGTPSVGADLITKTYADANYGGTGANTALSNLASTAVNAIIKAGSDNTIDLGTSAFRWSKLYATELTDSATVSVLDIQNRTLKNSGGTSVLDFSGSNIDITSRKIVNVSDPTSAQDAATKNYVDSATTGATIARVASTGNIVLNNLPASIDGVTMATSDVFLVNLQTLPEENGVYVYTTAGGTATRHTSWNSAAEFTVGKMVLVIEGDTRLHTLWANQNTITTLGTDAISIKDIGFDWQNVPTDLLPAQASSYNLGSGGRRFSNGFFDGALDLNNAGQVTGVNDPTLNQSAATKKYVDTRVPMKVTAKYVSRYNVALDNTTTTIDGASPVDGDRILVVGQSTASENGLYDYSSTTTWSRSFDADTSARFVPGFMIWVSSGNNYSGSTWAFILDYGQAFVLNTDAVSFYQTSSYPQKDQFTLTPTDITNQYVDLTYRVVDNSITFVVDGLVQTEGSDYTVSIVSEVTRLTFAGDLATGGPSALVSGDVLNIQYTR